MLDNYCHQCNSEPGHSCVLPNGKLTLQVHTVRRAGGFGPAAMGLPPCVLCGANENAPCQNTQNTFVRPHKGRAVGAGSLPAAVLTPRMAQTLVAALKVIDSQGWTDTQETWRAYAGSLQRHSNVSSALGVLVSLGYLAETASVGRAKRYVRP